MGLGDEDKSIAATSPRWTAERSKTQDAAVFVGHFGIALAGRALVPDSKAGESPSLGTFVLAAQFLDLVWPLLILADVEHVRIAPGITAVTPLDFDDYPWSHSLLMSGAWAIAVGGCWFALRRRAAPALLLGTVVVSHWVLDWVTHRPDMPIGIHGPYVGLGLWNSVLGTILVESAIFLGGLALYVRGTRPADRTGKWVLAGFAIFLVAFYAMSLVGPPPPDDKTVAWADLGMWLLVAWAYWIDRHRRRAGARST